MDVRKKRHIVSKWHPVWSQTGSYDFEKKKKPERTSLLGRICSTFSGKSSRRNALLDNDKYYLSLYNEGLLEGNYILAIRKQKHDNVLSVKLIFEYPVINICIGFSDKELITASKKCQDEMKRSVIQDFDGTNRVRVGINRVLKSEVDENTDPIIDGMPASMWLEVLEPAIQVLLLMETVRTHRSILTKRRIHLFPQPTHPRPIMGDVQQAFFIIGPLQQHWNNNAGLVAVFAHRIGELGERNRRRRLIREAETILPITSTTVRSSNKTRMRRTCAHPNARRSGSHIDQCVTTHSTTGN